MAPPAGKPDTKSGKGRQDQNPTRTSARLAQNDNQARELRPSSSLQPPSPPRETVHPEMEDQVCSRSKDYFDPATYPNAYEDPDPLPSDRPLEEVEENRKRILVFADGMLAAFQGEKTAGEQLWTDFICTFRPHSIKAWPKALTYKWHTLLSSRGVYIETGRNISRADALIKLLYRENHIGSDSIYKMKRLETHIGTARDQERPESQTQDLRHHYLSHRTTTKGRTGENNEGKSTCPSGYPGDEDPTGSSSDEDDNERNRRKDNWSKPRITSADKGTSYELGTSTNRTNKPMGHSLGISGLMKSFIGKKTFGGNWDEDLDSIISVFDTMSSMCQVSDKEKHKAIPVMLSGDALVYYSRRSTECTTYDEAVQLLRQWYNNPDKRARILTKWQSMCLSENMERCPDSSEIDVFRKFVAKLMSLQKQLDPSYHDDRFLRDRLMTAVDIPSIQVSLRDRIPRTAQQLVNRIANRLSEKPKTAGTAHANYAPTMGDPNGEEVLYTLGQNYGGAARRPIKPFGNRRPGQAGGHNHGSRMQHRLSPSWMRGIKGCFVCGKDHLARQRHSREEVTRAIERLKERHPDALLTVEDLAAVYEMGQENEEEPEEEEAEEYVQWAEDEQDWERTLAFITEDNGEAIEQVFATLAYLHGRGIDDPRTIADNGNGGADMVIFDGIRIDTCANRTSVISITQYRAYCRSFNLAPSIEPADRRKVRGIGGISESIGTVLIQVPFSMLGVVIDLTFLVIRDEIPTLLCMKDMVENGLDISIQGRYISLGTKRHPLTLENYFLVHRWTKEDLPYVLYTEKELRTLHRNFGHPSVKTTQHLLRRAQGSRLDKVTIDALEKIKRDCEICSRTASAPRRFKLTVGTGNLRFNHRVQVDTMYIQGRPVLHMVDEATHFCAASFLRSQSTKEIWKTIQRMWSLVYLGPPDFLIVDQGSSYTSAEMKQYTEASGVQLEEAPIETPGAIGTVERYHAPLRLAYERIRRDLDRQSSDKECLELAVFAVNCTIGPEGLCPILLVFGAVPRPARSTPAQSQMERARMIDRVMKEVEKEQAKRRIAFGLKHKCGPKAKEVSAKLHNLPSGSPVLVYRTTSKAWEGPFKFIQADRETAVIQMPRGRRIFRSTCVKPVVDPIIEDNEEDSEVAGMIASEEPGKSTASTEGKHPARKVTRKDTNRRNAEIFSQSRAEELQGLLKNGTFEIVSKEKIPVGTRIFGSRFVDQVKQANTGARLKSRLVAQNYGDREAATIATKAPTIQRFAQRLVLSLAASMPEKKTYTRDITQAYIQSTAPLERDVYIRAPMEMGLPDGSLLKVVKPLYGIPESGLHWYLTYTEHHLSKLNMSCSRADPCLLYKRDKNGDLEGMVILQVDDSLMVGSKEFLEAEERESISFRSKSRQELCEEPTQFNGLTIRRKLNGSIKVTQEEKIEKLKIPETQKGFSSQRALAQYIGVNCRPDICAAVQLIAPGNRPTNKQEFKSLAKTILFLKSTATQGLEFTPLDMDSMKVVLLSDASFANAEGMKSQLGYVVLLADNSGAANIVHYGSNRCHRVTRSVMAAEVHALVLGFDFSFVIRDALEEMRGRAVGLEAYVDSRTVFNVVVKDGKTAEKRLQIDIMALKESYRKGELKKMGWIPGRENAADALTKEILSKNSAMWRVMTENVIRIDPVGWATKAPTERNRAN